MLPNVKQKVYSSYSVRDLTTVYFENYAISSISVSPLINKHYFGENIEGKFYEKTEGKILVKAWLELPSQFPMCKLGQYCVKESEFSGILMIDNRASSDNSNKLIPIIISSFKARSAKLLNQFHGLHGRKFWGNTYREFRIENLDDLNTALLSLKD